MILSIGNINLDFHIFIDRIPEEDEEILSRQCILKCGGSASNLAVAIRRLGMRSRILGCIGDDLIGKILLNEFRKEDIDTKFVRIIKGTRSGQVFILKVGSGSKRMIAFRGANKYLDEKVIDIDSLKDVSWVHASSISSLRISKIFKEARRRNIITSYDPGSPVIREGINLSFLKELNFIFLNRLEAKMLTKSSEPLEIARYLAKINKDLIAIVKCGGRGAYLITREKIIFSKAFKVNVIDVTGAGDAFNAGFIYSFLKGYDFHKSLKIANAVAALKISKLGARETPTFKQVVDFLKEYDLNRL